MYRATNVDQPELDRNTTPERLLVLREWFSAIHHLILHVLDLVKRTHIGKLSRQTDTFVRREVVEH